MWSVAAQHFSRVMADGGGFGLAGMIERSLKQPAAGDAESV
jgi:Rod binding domain-containing protein